MPLSGGHGPFLAKIPTGAMAPFRAKSQISKIRKSKFCPTGTKFSKISPCGREIFNNSNQFSQFFDSKLTTCEPIFEPFWRQKWRFLGNFSTENLKEISKIFKKPEIFSKKFPGKSYGGPDRLFLRGPDSIFDGGHGQWPPFWLASG